MTILTLPAQEQHLQASYNIIQISDCHLLADIDGDYQGVKPGRYLQRLVQAIAASQKLPDAVILTGDLSQDHSFESYQLLATLLLPLTCPVLVLPGNHDNYEHLNWLRCQPPVLAATSIALANWQLILLDTKGESPAGYFEQSRREHLSSTFAASKAGHFWLFCHHHPLPVGSAIDKHGWQDAGPFWQLLATEPRVQGLAHGHCHHAYSKQHQDIHVVGCPASSVQFCQQDEWVTMDQGPMYCHWQFGWDGQVNWRFIQL